MQCLYLEFVICPVKNVMGIFMEIPYHFMSQSTAVWSKLTPNVMTMPCHLSRFYLFSMLKHDMNFGQVQVMEFPWHLPRKWRDFRRIWSHFRPNQTAVEKTWGNPCHIFYRVYLEFIHTGVWDIITLWNPSTCSNPYGKSKGFSFLSQPSTSFLFIFSIQFLCNHLWELWTSLICALCPILSLKKNSNNNIRI